MNKFDKHLIRFDVNSSKIPIYPYLPDTVMYLENDVEDNDLSISSVTNKCFSLPLENCTIDTTNDNQIVLDVTELYDNILDNIFANNDNYMQISIIYLLKDGLTFNDSWGNSFGMILDIYSEGDGISYRGSVPTYSFDNSNSFYKSLNIISSVDANNQTIYQLYMPGLYRTSISDFEEIRIYQCRDKATYESIK